MKQGGQRVVPSYNIAANLTSDWELASIPVCSDTAVSVPELLFVCLADSKFGGRCNSGVLLKFATGCRMH